VNKIILFTDLDGTLLDEKSYSSSLSLPAIRRLQSWGITIVFCSSKTRAEQKVLQKELSIRDPFIVENGSAIILPSRINHTKDTVTGESEATQVTVLGIPIKEIRKTLGQVVSKTGINYQSFSDLSNEQVAQSTGLDLESAKRAKNREYSETIVTKFSTSELEIFIHECELSGLKCTMGGRYLSVIGQGADKGKAVQALTSHYRSGHEDILTVGIGDSPNDVPMLEAVDFPYLVQRPDGHFESMKIANLNYISAIGPLGFTQMVGDLAQRWPELV
jgi:mannosyl-3-phosphoglycerate phosphatase